MSNYNIVVRPATLTGADVDPAYTPGAKVIVSGVEYTYWQVSASSANAASAGRVFYRGSSSTTVSDDYSAVNHNDFAGIAIGTVAKSSYGWFITDGPYSAILKKTGAVTANTFLVPSTTDGKVIAVTGGQAATKQVIAIAAESVTAAATTVSGVVLKR